MVIVDGQEFLTEEEKRLRQDRDRTKYWKRWGSYLSERQWATGIIFLHGLKYCADSICHSSRRLFVS
jgi:hypothetical protein